MPALHLRWTSLLLPLGLFALIAAVILTLRSTSAWHAATFDQCITEGAIGQWRTNDTCCEGLMRSTQWSVGSDGSCNKPSDVWTCVKCGRDKICGLGETICNCPMECAYQLPEGTPGNCIAEGKQGVVARDRCCPGLQARTVNPKGSSGDCTLTQKVFICTNCGDGRCGTGENRCNCQDCVTYPQSSSLSSALTLTLDGPSFVSMPGSATFHVSLTNVSGSPLSDIQLYGNNNMAAFQLDAAQSDSLCRRNTASGSYICDHFDLPAGATKDIALTFAFPVISINGTNVFALIRGPVTMDTAKFVAFTSCGNGTQDRFEQCDDGNLQSGDGCSEQCHVEADLSVSVPLPDVSESTTGTNGRKRLTYRIVVQNLGPTAVDAYQLRTGPLPKLTFNADLSSLKTCSAQTDSSVLCAMLSLPVSGRTTFDLTFDTSMYTSSWPETIDFRIRPYAPQIDTLTIDDPHPENNVGQALCGNGTLDAGEECDRGGWNSDYHMLFRDPPWCMNDCTVKQGEISTNSSSSSSVPAPLSSSSAGTAHANLAILNFTGPGRITAGATVEYSAYIANGGPDAAPNVFFDFFVPLGFTLLPAASSPACTVTSAQAMRCIPGNGTMAVNASATFTIAVQAPSTCTVVADMQSTIGSPNVIETFPSNNGSRIVSTLVCPPSSSSSASRVSSSIPASACGNGVVDAPAENCDDGNAVSGDGCSNICRFECTDTDPTDDPGIRGMVRSFYCSTGIPSCGEIVQQDSCIPDKPNQFVQYSCSARAPYFGAISAFSSMCPGNQVCQEGVCGYGAGQSSSVLSVSDCSCANGYNSCVSCFETIIGADAEGRCSFLCGQSSSSSSPAACGNGVLEVGEACEIGFSCPPINCLVAPCPQMRCDAASCSCVACPAVTPPACPGGVLFPQIGPDANGCQRPPVCCAGAAGGGQCTTNMSCTNGVCVVDSCICAQQCPAVTPPACPGGVLFPQIGPDANGCQRPPVCCAGAAGGGQCTTNMSCTNGVCVVDSCICDS